MLKTHLTLMVPSHRLPPVSVPCSWASPQHSWCTSSDCLKNKTFFGCQLAEEKLNKIPGPSLTSGSSDVQHYLRKTHPRKRVTPHWINDECANAIFFSAIWKSAHFNAYGDNCSFRAHKVLEKLPVTDVKHYLALQKSPRHAVHRKRHKRKHWKASMRVRSSWAYPVQQKFAKKYRMMAGSCHNTTGIKMKGCWLVIYPG